MAAFIESGPFLPSDAPLLSTPNRCPPGPPRPWLHLSPLVLAASHTSCIAHSLKQSSSGHIYGRGISLYCDRFGFRGNVGEILLRAVAPPSDHQGVRVCRGRRNETAAVACPTCLKSTGV
ncbi:hypothetical protein DPEC_G00328870 [Dallia pectoralis]|uniref:Uncharacterized protein n=1 Tax=Dallia pectoralis TaxID=75939 RepID=A0ACC2F8I3_DALPE|nr:hypothetical protein DPEC_G00328870 [Dallia pectoralis]